MIAASLAPLLLLLVSPAGAVPVIATKPVPAEAKAKPATPAAEAEEEAEEGEEEAEEDADENGERSSLFFGLSVSGGREANVLDRSWGPTATLDLVSTDQDAPNRIRYGLEASYNDATTRFVGADGDQHTRARTLDLRYARISLIKLFGFDLRQRLGLTPFVAGGLQHVDSTTDQTVEDENTGARSNKRTDEHFWSPSWGVGAEVRLNSRLNFVLDYNRNTESGEKATNRLSLEMKVRVFGDEQ